MRASTVSGTTASGKLAHRHMMAHRRSTVRPDRRRSTLSIDAALPRHAAAASGGDPLVALRTSSYSVPGLSSQACWCIPATGGAGMAIGELAHRPATDAVTVEW
jgi:hypothetical protein